MTPRCHQARGAQVLACARLMIRSVSGRTVTIRSRIGSSGKVITSTMTCPPSRRPTTPPRAPAEAASAASVNSTTSPISKSCISVTPSIVRLGVGSNQTRSIAFRPVVPSSKNRRGPITNDQVGENSAANSSLLPTELYDRSKDHSFNYRIPDEAGIASPNMEDALPFSTVSLRSKDPVQLGPSAPCVRCPREWITEYRWQLHSSDPRRLRRTCVRLSPFLRVESHTEGVRT
jgi:hypothetical protein